MSSFKLACILLAVILFIVILAFIITVSVLTNTEKAKTKTKKVNKVKLNTLLASFMNATLSRNESVMVKRIPNEEYAFELTSNDMATVHIYPNYHYICRNITQPLLPKPPNKYRIFMNGEPNNFRYPLSDFDLSLSTNRADTPALYVAYFGMYMRECGKKIDMIPRDVRTTSLDRYIHSRPNYIFFAYSNNNTVRFDGVSQRNRFYKLLRGKIGGVLHNGGKTCGGPDDDVTSKSYKSNDQLLKTFQFCIAFENQCDEGYITEKLINPLLAGCIPIYRGAPDASVYINKDAFINVHDFESLDSCAEFVLNMTEDDKFTMASAPVFTEEFFQSYTYQYIQGVGKVWAHMAEKIPNLIPVFRQLDARSHFITFADGKVYTGDRVMREAQAAGYFADLEYLNPSNLSRDFLQQNREFITNNPHGFGFYRWKSFCVKAALANIEMGEYLTYLDCGFIIVPNKSTQVLGYYRSIGPDTEFDVMAFANGFREKEWNKEFVVNKLLDGETPERRSEILESDQVAAGAIMIRKTPESVALVARWADLSEIDRMINDDLEGPYDNQFVTKHRHDQSIWSLLFKLYPRSVVNIDNQTDVSDESTMVFAPARKRN